ncbi:MAG: hypothetical protein HY565_03355 [Candidatus Kerfeldbacteria bacterium]|nr:hypothetical protein [Candidatus Kerfeldbacteria bacterium]
MGNFNRGGRSDDRGGFRGGRDSGRGGYGGNRGGGGFSARGGSAYGGRDRNEDREMFQATCTECGKSCEVPFKPSGGKPVLCRDCFRVARGNDHGDRGDRGSRDSGSRDFSYRDVNDRHSEGGNVGGKSAEHFDQQFAQLNEKLDRILKRLTPAYTREAPAETVVAAESEAFTSPDPKKVAKKKATKKKD